MLLYISDGPLASGLGPCWVLFIIIDEPESLMVFVWGRVPGLGALGSEGVFGGRGQQLPFLVLGLGTLDPYCVFLYSSLASP